MSCVRPLVLILGFFLLAPSSDPSNAQTREGSRAPGERAPAPPQQGPPVSVEEATLAACPLKPLAAGRVSAVIDGRTFVLDDGRTVRLGSIEVPAMLAGETDARGGAGLAAKAALAALVHANEVALKYLAPATDRYGRVLAYGFVRREGVHHWIERDLIARGRARVSARVDERTCAAALLATEQAARSAKLGLWRDPYYEMKLAERPAEVLAQRGRFALVRGKVVSVRESGGTIYVNFGRRWSEDFTVTLLKRNERIFLAAGIAPKKLAGRLVEVRGWIEERGGPWIEATRPEQIMIVEGN